MTESGGPLYCCLTFERWHNLGKEDWNDNSDLSDENDVSSSQSLFSSNNNNDMEDVDFEDEHNIDYDDNILNLNGPAIELYQSELDDTDDSDLEDVEQDINWRNRALELKEDQYWANHHSGESYLADTAEDSSSDGSDESTLS